MLTILNISITPATPFPSRHDGGGALPAEFPQLSQMRNKNAQWVICLGRKGDQSLKGERSWIPSSLRFYWVQLRIHSMHEKLINQCSKCYWHHLQIIVEERQGLSLVRVGFGLSVCFIATGQSRSQRKQCIFFLWPDLPLGALWSSTKSQLPLGIVPRLNQAGRAKQTRD